MHEIADGGGGGDVVAAIDRLRDADAQLARRRVAGPGVGETDRSALRLVLERYADGRATTPTDIADHLCLTTSAVTSLLDRLVAAGLARTAPHPRDRRRKVVLATAEAASELDPMGDRIQEIVEELSPRQRAWMVGVLDRITDVVQHEARDARAG